MGEAAIPLERMTLFHSCDLEEAREQVARVFKPHRLDFIGRQRMLDARQNRAVLVYSSLNYLRYGADVLIEPDRLDSFFLIQMPIRGRMAVKLGNNEIVSRPGTANICSPTLPLTIHWLADCESLTVQIPRSTMERFVADYLGVPVRRPVEFELPMDVEQGPCGSWRRIVAFVCDELERTQSVARSPLVRHHFEDILLATLVAGQHHSYSALAEGPASEPSPYYVKRAEEYMLAHADEPVTIRDLVRVAGVSARSLFAGFRKHRGIGPMNYLKMIRLDRARADLTAADPHEATVTEIALKWGFSHFGHFSAAYARRFGERPSETLRRRKI